MNDLSRSQNDVGVPQIPEPTGSDIRYERQAQSVVPTALVLMLSVPLSSSSPHPEKDWVQVFAQYSTPHSFGEYSTKGSRKHHALPVTAEQLAAVQTFFGLSKTQLARVCKVQRQTIYDWYAGRFEAEGNHARRLARLYGVAERLRSDGFRPLSVRVVARALSSGNTLLDLLSADDVDGQEVGGIVAQLDEGTKIARARSAEAIRVRLGWAPTSEESGAKNLEANLDEVVDG